MKFTVLHRLPGYNELHKGHWAARQRIKNDAMDCVVWYAKRARLQPASGKVCVKITCYEPNRKRDPSNVRAGAEKIILDALQNCGIIKNDNWAMLEDCPAQVYYDSANPRVEVEIIEVEIK